jgi:transcription-repair coupling factor (superfamily II helicase)
VRDTVSLLGAWEGFRPLAEQVRQRRCVEIEGPYGAASAYVLAALRDQIVSPLLVIVSSQERAEQLWEDLSAFLAEGRDAGKQLPELLALPSPDTVLYEEMSLDPALRRDRLRALWAMIRSERWMVITTPDAAVHATLPPGVLRESALHVRVGQNLDRDFLAQRLAWLGYRAEQVVEEEGAFSLRGGIVDVFPSTSTFPLRVELLGDQVESIRCFDAETQRTTGEQQEAEILPVSELVLPENASAAHAALEAMKAALEIQARSLEADSPEAAAALREKVGRDIAEMAQGALHPRLQYYLPYLFGKQATAIDHLPQSALVVIEEPQRVAESWERIEQEARARYDSGIARGALLQLPHMLHGDWHAAQEGLRQRGMVCIERLRKESSRADLILSALHAGAFSGRVDEIAGQLQKWQREGRRVMAITRQDRRLSELLAEAGITGVVQAPDLKPGQMAIVRGDLSAGFQLPDAGLVVLTDSELFGWTKQRRAPRRRRAPQTMSLASVAQLREGDFVVHVRHGIGIYGGLVRKTVEGAQREYVMVRYAGQDKLYVPVDQLDRVQKYIGGEDQVPTINRLGTSQWERTKRRVRKAAQDMARELVALYAARQARPGHAFAPDSPWQREMEDGFAYEETPDQWNAIEEIKRDMEQPMPMDRLLCGDVGYGKTEVAIRAAFKAVMDYKQVAVLVPTTVLAQQHFGTFRERLTPYPVRVEMLSRFLSRSAQHKVIEGLASGEVDIVIGTHRLLSKDVQFKNLSLIIVDEEHRFGVRHKERLKQLRPSVDVLSMTATPIPRTLHMALSRIREMSVIRDAPEGRIPIRTKASARDDMLLDDAILREVARQGQVFFVHNRVESIAHVADKLHKMLPGVRIAIAHGQLPETELERVMLDFYAGRYDMLVCTSIIESGLDVPNANTIVVDESERLGLAQLYQLRGRVGRSDRQAYAYLTWTPHKRLSDSAEKRIAAIREFSELGSGFKIALRDLEIRGAGNLLGPEQHGFMAAVGFEMYCQMLAEAVSQLKGEIPPPPETEIVLDLPVDAYLPEDYVPSLQQRIDLYRRMASVKNEEQIGDMRQELEDRFGEPLPAQTANLLRLLGIKMACLRAGTASVTTERMTVSIRLPDDKRLEPDEIDRLRRQLAASGREDLRLAMPQVAIDRVVIHRGMLSAESLCGVVQDLVEHLGKIITGSKSRGATLPERTRCQ